MKTRNLCPLSVAAWSLLALMLFASPFCIRGQTGGVRQKQGDDELRNIWDDGLVRKRPRPTGKRKSYRFKRVTPALSQVGGGRPGAQRRDVVVGVTVWRLRPSLPSDEVRELVHVAPAGEPAGGGLNLTAERTEAGTPLSAGERVRISVESPRAGYLYVVNREQYRDGTSGPPVLIFPTERTLEGNNQVQAGRVVTIPARGDDPPFFTVRPNPRRKDQVAELLLVILSEQPLGLSPAPEAQVLSAVLVDGWEKTWAAPFERLEQEGGAGTPITEAELEAGAGGRHELTQGDPAPQTIYHVKARSGVPVLLRLSLPFKGAEELKAR